MQVSLNLFTSSLTSLIVFSACFFIFHNSLCSAFCILSCPFVETPLNLFVLACDSPFQLFKILVDTLPELELSCYKAMNCFSPGMLSLLRVVKLIILIHCH